MGEAREWKLLNADIRCFHSGYTKTLPAVHMGSKLKEINLSVNSGM
jgi:hypothetical protein